MAWSGNHGELAKADDCPFCGSDFLFFSDGGGAVACDDCQAEGPYYGPFNRDDPQLFAKQKRAAVKLWNRRAGDE